MIEINLLPGSTRKASRRMPGIGAPGVLSKLKLPQGGDSMTLVIAGTTVLGLLLVGWLYTSTRTERQELEISIEGAVRDSARFAAMRAANEELVARQDTIAQKVAIIQDIDSGRFVWAHIFDEISRAVPPFTWLTLVETHASTTDQHAPTVEIQGRAGNTLALTRFIEDLESSPFLGRVTLQTTQQVEVSGRKLYEFTLEVQYQVPPADLIQTAPLFAPSDSIVQGD